VKLAREVRRISLAFLALALAHPARAADARLAQRFDPSTTVALEAIVREARSAGLPTEPLVDRALEGASRRLPPERVVSAVRAWAGQLGRSRGALGTDATEAELVAGAAALVVGVPAESLSRLRELRQSQSLVTPLVVVADLVVRRVPIGVACDAVAGASRAGVNDERLLLLRRRIESAIRAGSSPQRAAESQLRALVTEETAAGRVPPPAPRGPVRVPGSAP
jgi:hypothetical protein